MINIARTTNRKASRWRDGHMLRGTAAGRLSAERSFRRIKGYQQMITKTLAIKQMILYV